MTLIFGNTTTTTTTTTTTYNNNNNKAKVKMAAVYVMKTFRGSRGVALLILHLAARWW